MLKLWGRVNSLNVQKVLWALAELDLAYERVDAGLQFGVNDTPDYRAMNPNGLVPTLDDDGLILWESNVIVRYLATRYGLGTLCPADAGERALAERWMDWQATTFYPPLGPAFINLVRTPPDKRDAAAIEASRATCERLLAILDDQLATRDFVNGSSFTMGDIPIGASVYRWYALPLERASHPHVEDWLARLKTRPGFAAHVALPLS